MPVCPLRKREDHKMAHNTQWACALEALGHVSGSQEHNQLASKNLHFTLADRVPAIKQNH
jgi:hypothetical protein